MFALRRSNAALPSLFDAGTLTALRREMDDLFENFMGGRVGAVWQEMQPRLDVVETGDGIEVTTDVPGFTKDEISIDLGDNTLTISGQRVEEQRSEGDGKKYHQLERRSGSFTRSVWLPCAVDESKVEAELKDGVLTIKLPKAAEAKRKKITVNG